MSKWISSDTTPERLHSQSVGCVMSPRHAADLEWPLSEAMQVSALPPVWITMIICCWSVKLLKLPSVTLTHVCGTNSHNWWPKGLPGVGVAKFSTTLTPQPCLSPRPLKKLSAAYLPTRPLTMMISEKIALTPQIGSTSRGEAAGNRNAIGTVDSEAQLDFININQHNGLRAIQPPIARNGRSTHRQGGTPGNRTIVVHV